MKVTRFVLGDSIVFNSTFATCRVDGQRPYLDGWSDRNPILLHGHSVKAFEDLLRVIHAK
jgi:hypothetical protein